MVTDTIADMLTRIRNGLSRRLEVVEFPYSKMKESVLVVLKQRHMIDEFTVANEGVKKSISVKLKYYNGTPAITELKRISKPGRRVYTDYKSIPVVKNNYGFMILSTSKGIKDTFSARKEKLGGEIMCEIL